LCLLSLLMRHQDVFHQMFDGLVHLGPVWSLSRTSYILGRP
jgi:hypothetical protein